MKRFDKLKKLIPGKFKAGRSTNLLVIHCAATPEDRDIKTQTVHRWHTNKGWNQIGYHFFIELDGTIVVGRPIRLIGAHVRGWNKKSIGISYAGGVDKALKPKDTRTPAQKKSLLMLTKILVADNYDITRIAGHNEFSAKACPSFNVKTDALGNIAGFKNGIRI